MFRTCGFFLSVPCQYYLNGLCERPFCHFRHSKHDVEKARAESASYTVGDDLDSSASDNTGQQSASSGSGPQTSTSSSGSSKENGLNSEPSEKDKASPQSPCSIHENGAGSFSIPLFTDNSSKYEVPVAEEPEQYLTSCDDDTDKGLGSSPYSSVEAAGASKALPAYLPTPKTPSLPVPKPEKNDLGIPVYQPTPKRELKRRHKDEVRTKKSKSADLEYDPECNYSCQGFVGGSQEKGKIESDDMDYKPSEKKARISGLARGRKRLSCESLRSPPAQGEEVLEGEFSDQEEDSVDKANKVLEETMEEGVSKEDGASDSFENIGDDDISSDDDFIDVPSVTDDESAFKQQKPSVKTMDKKSSGSRPGSAKTISSEKAGKKVVVNKKSEAGLKETRVKKSKQVSSKYSGHDKQSKSSSHKKLEKTDKLSSQKTTGQPASSGSSKKSSSVSASVKGHSTEKNHSSEKTRHISKQSSQQKTEHSTHDEHIKHKTKALKSNHTGRPSSNHKSLFKSSSSKKINISGKPPSSSKKAVLSGSKTPSSSSVSHSSSAKIPNADVCKSKDSGQRRSSLESITSKAVASKSSDRDDDNKSKHSSNRRPSFESKASKDHSGKYDREIQSKMERKSLTSVSMKHSDSDTRSNLNKTLKKHSNSENKTPSGKLVNSVPDRHKLPSGKRSTSTDSINSSSGSKRPREQSHHHHSSSASKIKTGSSSRDHSKDRSAHSEDMPAHGDRVHHSSKSGKEYRSSQSESQKTSSSSGKHTSSVKVTNSSSHHKSEKPRDSKSDSNRSYNSKTLERMNSTLFGEDSDEEDAAENLTAFDDGNPVDTGSDFSDNVGAVEEERIDYGYINDSDLEEEDTFDECLRIFKEAPLPKKTSSQPEKKLTKDQKKDGPGSSGATYIVPGKKRIAHKAAEQICKPAMVRKEKPRQLLSPQEQMHNRILLMHQRAQERAAARQAVQEQEVSSTSGSAPSARPQGLNSVVKKRIAHVPKPATASTPSATKTPLSGGQKKTTVATTASKTEKRQAHTPNVVQTNLKRPMIPGSFGSKVPSNIRQRYLNLIIDECLKFCPSEEEAYKKGLEEESGVYDRSTNKNIYLRVAVNTITRLRTEARESMPGSSAPKQQRPSGPSQSHEATLGGARAAKTNFTLHRSSAFGKKTEVALTGPELYQKLMKYAMMDQQLEENGYPRSCPDTPGKAIMLGKSYQDTDTLLKDNERTCARCGKRFMVNSNGSYVRQDECVYHWTRAYPRKKSGFIQHIYNCCNSDTSSKGCQVAANHVHDRNKRDKLVGFMQTMPHSAPKDGNYGIYALDCEMVYTVGGLELARVTVVNTEGESVFESLVQPLNAIVDYNTRFSGLTAAHLKDVDTTLTDVQAVLLNLFSEKTILIGHSLESDFFALKLIHSTVVDTSVVFPHRLGPPYKRALKNLMLEIFQKIIQCDDGGHDSKEDAVSCLQLMKWRIKEDSKRESRYSRD